MYVPETYEIILTIPILVEICINIQLKYKRALKQISQHHNILEHWSNKFRENCLRENFNISNHFYVLLLLKQ